MTRTTRLAVVATVALIVVASGSALAFNGEGENAERVVELLDDAGVTTDASELDQLADEYGLGGGVRILAFADAAGVDPSEVAAMRDAGMGWGQIARALAAAHPEFDLKPGLGWIMGGNGHGHGQGQANRQGQTNGQGHGHGHGGGDEGGDDPGG